MDRTAPGRTKTCVTGRDRIAKLFFIDAPGRHWNAHCYERDRIATQFSVSGTAPGHSLLWPGPPWDGFYYGRDRTGTLIAMAGATGTLITMAGPTPGRWLLWLGPTRRLDLIQGNLKGVGGWMASSTFASFCLSSCHKAFTLYLTPAPKKCFTTHIVRIRFLRILHMLWWCKASTTNQVRVQSGRGTLPISLCMASMPAHVDCKPWAGIFDSLTWPPAHFLAWEMVPFFPDTNALHPCTLTVHRDPPRGYVSFKSSMPLIHVWLDQGAMQRILERL